MENLIIRIGKLVREKRLGLGYTTQELADKLEVSAGLINNIENAKTDSFNLSFMGRLCSALDVPLISILASNTEDISKLLNISNNIPEALSYQINEIIQEYIKVAIKFNFNADKLDMITDKILCELRFVNKIIE